MVRNPPTSRVINADALPALPYLNRKSIVESDLPHSSQRNAFSPHHYNRSCFRVLRGALFDLRILLDGIRGVELYTNGSARPVSLHLYALTYFHFSMGSSLFHLLPSSWSWKWSRDILEALVRLLCSLFNSPRVSAMNVTDRLSYGCRSDWSSHPLILPSSL
nr:hypothetical protein CFP56_39021 [Quercus suber]